MIRFIVEHTDTFGGGANQCWCDRKTFEVDDNASDLSIVRKAKKLMGLNGVRGTTQNLNREEFIFRPYRLNQILFINFDYSNEPTIKI